MRHEEVLLFSGGIDSFCAFKHFRSFRGIGVDSLYFDLGTPYTAKEIDFVTKVDKEITIDISLKFLGETQVGSKAFVPYRNIFLAMRAASLGYKKIWIAGVKDDVVNDKSDIAFRDFSAFLTRYSIDGKPVIVDSPFWDRTKASVVKWALNSHLVTVEELLSTVSCYSAAPTNYCGQCNSCFRKFIALRSAGIKIDFYNDPMMEDYYAKCAAGNYDVERAEDTMKVIENYWKERAR